MAVARGNRTLFQYSTKQVIGLGSHAIPLVFYQCITTGRY